MIGLKSRIFSTISDRDQFLLQHGMLYKKSVTSVTKMLDHYISEAINKSAPKVANDENL